VAVLKQEISGKYIGMAHGSGGKLSHDLIKNVIAKEFKNPILDMLHDGAKLNIDGARLAFTTDGYVVKPRFFPGGDIGKLSVCGTVNDLAVTGAEPLYLSAGFVLEEGFSLDELERIVRSMAETAASACVHIVTGDTKVVEKGAVDGIFINTAGIGRIFAGVNIDACRVKPGQEIIINGYLGDHAVAVMSERHGLNLPETIISDCAPLNSLVKLILETDPNTIMLRDPTRGGLATTLNEIASQARAGIMIEEDKIPIRPEVKAVCDILGFDPLYLANEGKLIVITENYTSQEVLSAMRSHPLGKDAQIIGKVSKTPAGQVGLVTSIGSVRLLDMLTGEQMPRIC
jgi:hydrogenase expression/formation protein HypE